LFSPFNVRENTELYKEKYRTVKNTAIYRTAKKIQELTGNTGPLEGHRSFKNKEGFHDLTFFMTVGTLSFGEECLDH